MFNRTAHEAGGNCGNTASSEACVSAGAATGIAYDNRNFSLGLAGLRGFAAVAVVIYHVFHVLPIAGIDGPQEIMVDVFYGPLLAQHVFLGFFNGRGAVTLFFVLSGCVLALSLDRQPRFGLRDMGGYLVRRGFRLYPLLIFAASLGAMLQYFMQPGAIEAVSRWVNWHYNVPNHDLPREWLLNALGVSDTLNSPAWSIRVELLASLIFPVLYLLSLHPWRAAASGVCFVGLMFVLPGNPHRYLLMNIFTFSFFLGALIPRYGALVANWYGKRDRRGRLLILAATVLPFMFARRLIEPSTFAPPPVVLIETLCSAMIVTLVLYRPAPPILTRPFAQILGRVSYGIYLLHLIVLFALVHIFFPVIPPLEAAGAVPITVFLCIATLAITVAASFATYELLEAPFQRAGSRAAKYLDKLRKSADPDHAEEPKQPGPSE